jgi:putative hydrolases of HD superfamily
MANERLARQIGFILEIDRLKQVFRRNSLLDGTRRENDAEHSWHLAAMALVLAEYADEKGLDLLRVLKMLVIHDLVEIDAGDAFVYDSAAMELKAGLEQRAAERIFGLLPGEQGQELRELWEDFEARKTPEARFASALDRLQPLLINYHTGGGAWRQNGIRSHQVLARNAPIGDASEELWEYARGLIEDAVRRGFIEE